MTVAEENGVIVPRPLADVVRELTDNADPPLGRGAHRYTLRDGCPFCEAVPDGAEDVWTAVLKERIEERDVWRPWDDPQFGRAPADPSLPEMVWKFLPPEMVAGTLTLVTVAEGTRITCSGCDLEDSESYLRDVYPELFEQRAGARGSRQEAEAFLRELLADGELWAKEATQAAIEYGITAKTLRNASQYVADKRRGEGNKSIWRLRGREPVERTPSPAPYARTRARCPGENEGQVGPVGPVLGAEPETTGPSGDEGPVKGPVDPETTGPTDPKGQSKGQSILAPQAVPALHALHAPRSARGVARAREDDNAHERRDLA